MWILFAFAGPVLWAASVHIDKYLVEKYFKDSSTTVLMVFTALIGLLALPFIWWHEPMVFHQPLFAIAVMVASGLLYMVAILFYLQALQTEEASVVAPLSLATPIWSCVLAYLFLGETLTPMQLVGSALILASGVALSLDSTLNFGRLKSGLLLRMGAATFVIALSSVIFKIFAVRDDYWVTTFWTFVGEALFGLVILAIPAYSRQLWQLIRLSPAAILTVNGANELINLGGGLGLRYALVLAPIALVQAVSSTTSLFVFIFGIILTVFLPAWGKEDLSRRNLLRKGVGAALVVVGILLINR
jgi:uncharacterized membrane protein